MTLSPFYRRMLWLSLALFLAGLIVTYWPQSTPEVVSAGDTPARAEARLAQLRDTAATIPAKEKMFKDAQADLAAREKGLIVADTAAQAQAQLISILREVGRRETPPVEIRGTEGFGIRAFGDSYGEASVSVQLQCPIDQLVNLLASIASRPELVSTSDLRVTSANAKDKTVNVRLTICGIVPRKLVPEKRTASLVRDSKTERTASLVPDVGFEHAAGAVRDSRWTRS